MVCNYQQDQRDDSAFSLAIARHGSFNNARVTYSQHFSMAKSDWDEGWGWQTGATDRPFAKMIASGYILERGVGAYPEATTPMWTKSTIATPVALRDPLVALKIKQPLGETTEDGRELYREHSHAFATDAASHLQHYFERIVTDAGGVSMQFTNEDVSLIATPTPASAIGAICALSDDPSPEPSADTWCYRLDGRPLKAGIFDRTALLWVFGRAADGEVLVYYADWYTAPPASPQWRHLSLSTVLPIANPANAAGRAEVPAVMKTGSPAAQRVDIVMRSGFKLYHFWREGPNTDVAIGWQGEDVAAAMGLDPARAQVTTRPTLIPEPSGRGFHVFARNENNALLQFTYTFESTATCRPPFPTVLPCTIPIPASWAVRNVDNEIDGVSSEVIVVHNDVVGPVNGVATDTAALHVFQRKTTNPLGLFHYILDGPAWRRDVWWGLGRDPATGNLSRDTFTGDPAILLNDEAELRPDDFPFGLYITGRWGGLYGFEYIENGADDWLSDAITREAVAITDPSTIPAMSLAGPVAVTIARFEEWLVRNVFGRSAAGGIVRHVWLNRSGWVGDGLPSVGWKAEALPDSVGRATVPAVTDFERLLDVYTFTASALVRHRLTRDRPWHSARDYYNWASGSKYGFDYEPEDSDEHNALSTAWPAWNANMYCPCFSNWDAEGVQQSPLGPAERASTMLHEATHLNKHFRGSVSVWQHEERDGVDVDPWFSHGLWQSAPGGLEPADHKHSMYQIKVEFLTDLAEFPAADLPRIVWSGAIALAQSTMQDRIMDIPPWSPGLPRPLT